MERILAYPQIFCAGVNNIITIMPRKRKPGTEIGLAHSLIFLSKRLLRNLHSPLFSRKIVQIERYALRVAILDECQNSFGGGGRSCVSRPPPPPHLP